MLLSLIIPVFNTNPKFLSECLDSLKHIDLSISDFEIIIVNDGSTNKTTLSFLKNINLKKNYKIINVDNGGPGYARNIGIQNALGEYIFPLDSDDMVSPNINFFINKLITDKTIDVIYGNLNVFGDENYIATNPKYNPLILFFKDNIIPASSFFKKSIHQQVNGYDESLKSIEDYDFWIKVALITNKIEYINTYAYHYRRINDGSSRMQNTINAYEINLKTITQKIPLSNEQLNSYFISAFRKTKKSHIFNLIYHYYFGKTLNNSTIYSFFSSTYLEKISKRINVSEVDLHHYLDLNFKTKKRLLIALSLYLYTPLLYKMILSLGGFSFKYKFI